MASDTEIPKPLYSIGDLVVYCGIVFKVVAMNYALIEKRWYYACNQNKFTAAGHIMWMLLDENNLSPAAKGVVW
jgi:hypothetical protein